MTMKTLLELLEFAETVDSPDAIHTLTRFYRKAANRQNIPCVVHSSYSDAATKLGEWLDANPDASDDACNDELQRLLKGGS